MGKHTPADEQRRLVELWHQSDASMAAFARDHGVHPGTFGSWVSRHRAPVPAPAFLRLALADEVREERAPTGTAGTFAVELRELRLRFDAPPPPAWFAAVLRELGPC